RDPDGGQGAARRAAARSARRRCGVPVPDRAGRRHHRDHLPDRRRADRRLPGADPRRRRAEPARRRRRRPPDRDAQGARAMTERWLDDNQRYLVAALAAARRWLEGKRDAGRGELDRLARDMARPPALEQLVAAFGLTPFERGVLLL